MCLFPRWAHWVQVITVAGSDEQGEASSPTGTQNHRPLSLPVEEERVTGCKDQNRGRSVPFPVFPSLTVEPREKAAAQDLRTSE